MHGFRIILEIFKILDLYVGFDSPNNTLTDGEWPSTSPSATVDFSAVIYWSERRAAKDITNKKGKK